MATIEDLEKQIKDLKKGFEESLKQKSSIIVQSPPKVKKFSGDRKELTLKKQRGKQLCRFTIFND